MPGAGDHCPPRMFGAVWGGGSSGRSVTSRPRAGGSPPRTAPPRGRPARSPSAWLAAGRRGRAWEGPVLEAEDGLQLGARVVAGHPPGHVLAEHGAVLVAVPRAAAHDPHVLQRGMAVHDE